jgi:hypothetical protein
LGDRLAVTRDDYALAILDCANQFRKAIFSFSDGYIHDDIIAIIYDYRLLTRAAQLLEGLAARFIA